MVSIKDNLRFLHQGAKAIKREAKEIDKSATKHFSLYDANNISEKKKLIIELGTICQNFDLKDKEQKKIMQKLH